MSDKFPALSVAVSPIKSIQRGTAASAGNITISAVNVNKTTVRSFSNAADGSAAVSGDVNAFTISGTLNTGTGPRSFVGGPGPGQGIWYDRNASAATLGGNLTSANISGGTSNIAAKEFGVYLQDSTTLVATGPCIWEVVEFN